MVVVKGNKTYDIIKSMVWWPETQQLGPRRLLSSIQRLACLSVMMTMRTTSTATKEVILNLPSLHIYMQGEAIGNVRTFKEGISTKPTAQNGIS